jgi:hypothetical protein
MLKVENRGYIYFDGCGFGKGGLCDRLKGMYSSYNLSLSLNKDFFYDIHFPVALKALNYKQPDNKNYSNLYVIDWDNYLSFEHKITKMDFNEKNYRIQTNIDFSEKLPSKVSFSDFFKTFFDLKSLKDEMGIFEYDMAIHLRCGGKMVEWNDSNFGEDIDEDLFLYQLEDFLSINKKHDIYICSDSKRLLEKINKMNFNNVITSPNQPKHVDRSENILEDDYRNVLYDLLTLANSKIIYYTKGEFAKTASRIYNNDIKKIFT